MAKVEYVYAFDDTVGTGLSVGGKVVTTSDQAPPSSLSGEAWSSAAALCNQTISSKTDWYLPVICEMGYDTYTQGSGCGSSIAPTMQNMYSSIYSLYQLSGLYWSSSSLNSLYAWAENFARDGSDQFASYKPYLQGVRCSRVF